LSLNTDLIRKDFKSLSRIFNKKPVIYLDNACTTLKPTQVVEAMDDYYYNYPSCHGRTFHKFGRLTTEKYAESRKKVSEFLGTSKPAEIIFLRNVTEGINLVANSLKFEEGDAVVTTNVEHNSNLIPWQVIKNKKKIDHRIVDLNPDLTFNMDNFIKAMDGKVKLVSMGHCSNLSGVSIPAEEIIEYAHKKGAYVLLDGAQSAAHHKIDVKKMDVDFFAVSFHKLLGPSGFGALYGKEDILMKIPPFILGGETVVNTTYDSFSLAPIPDKFEAGLQNYAGAIGAGAACDYFKKFTFEDIHEHINSLNSKLTEKLKTIDGINIIGPSDPSKRAGVVNFTIEGMKALEVAHILDESSNIMVRAGVHCVHSWFNQNKVSQSIRVSFYIYNTPEEVDIFFENIKNIIKFFK
jgi:cysteine desulfurase / selenocysteine lyase